MKCPVCRTEGLTQDLLEGGLPSFMCGDCEGWWLEPTAYWKWLEQRTETTPEIQPEVPVQLKSDVAEKARICPICQRILNKYNVGHGVGFTLDRCEACAGIWFDKDEWTILKSRRLHDDVHLIFTAPWQAEARKEELRLSLEGIYKKRFGEQDFEEVKRIREWLDQSALRSELLAYLNDPNPHGL
jgi:Zn-finger nucleic acid-binding protein